jgi:predicted permease
MVNILSSLLLILSGLALGYFLKILQLTEAVHLPLKIVDLRKILQKIALLFLMPVSFLGAVWVVSFGDLRVVWLPVVGVTALLSGGVLGLLFSRILGLAGEQRGVMYCCGSFTNIGAIGGLICFLFLGEEGFALVALYKMFEEISYYTIGFPIARFYSSGQASQGSLLQRFSTVLRDPFVITAFSAFCIGLLLNLSGVERPHFYEKVIAFSVPAGTFILIFSIGLGMRFSSVTSHLRECAAVSTIKFILIPTIACSLAYLLNLHEVAGGLPFQVVMILSSMPVAFNALVAASIFDLDLDLANSLWLVSTGLLVVVLPWLFFIVPKV